MTTGARALYLCYFVLREALVQTQVLVLRELVADLLAVARRRDASTRLRYDLGEVGGKRYLRLYEAILRS